MTTPFRSLKKSTLYYSALQASEYALPLIAIPYLIRTLGISGYGSLAFAQAVGGYFYILTEFGFNFTGGREAAIARNDKERLSTLFFSIQTARLVLFFVSLICMAVIATLPAFKSLGSLLFLALLPALGNVLYPFWFFQGIDRAKECVLIVVTVRVLLVCALLVLVENESDLSIAALLLFGPLPVAGLIVLVRIARLGVLDLQIPRAANVRQALIDAKHSFFALAGSSLYRSTNAVVLGIVSTTSHVAYYTVAEKLIRAVQESNRPIALATYPRISAYSHTNPSAARAMLRRVAWIVAGIGAVASLCLYLLAPEIITVIAGAHEIPGIEVLQLMAIAPLLGSLNLVLGAQSMHALGLSKDFSKLVVTTGLISLLLIVPLAAVLDSKGAATCYVVSEAFLLASLIRYHKRRRIIWN